MEYMSENISILKCNFKHINDERYNPNARLYYKFSTLNMVRNYLMDSIDKNNDLLSDDIPILRHYVDVMYNLMLDEIDKTKPKVNEKPNIYDVILYSEDVSSDMKVKLLKVLENKL